MPSTFLLPLATPAWTLTLYRIPTSTNPSLLFLTGPLSSLPPVKTHPPSSISLLALQHGHCINELLLDSARTRIVSLSSSIRTRFPFDVIFDQPLRLTGPETGGDGDRVAAPVMGRRVRRRRVSGRKGKTLAVSVVDSPMRLSWGFG
ncbi:uncharacterized protein A4U43_C09F12040 [Asparagus officinalis]|uniref:Uncharacterized protein n=1 Tax=Asparagus officinalis TaxID=4686 RepID=A0A5P1E8Y3_ASPOF|nr:uncharacterized protein A4U43_C09F12040 [Asparagus officinalis]